MVYCSQCGQMPGTRIHPPTWDVVYVKHHRYIDGHPELCPASLWPVGTEVNE